MQAISDASLIVASGPVAAIYSAAQLQRSLAEVPDPLPAVVDDIARETVQLLHETNSHERTAVARTANQLLGTLLDVIDINTRRQS